MDTQTLRTSNSLFEVYLRLRPSSDSISERFLDVEQSGPAHPTSITIRPVAQDNRRRAVEKFAFTRVFEEQATQLDIFKGAEVLSLVQSAVATDAADSRDGLVATLGVTGSGKSHTILGSRNQRGVIQMTLDLLFQSLDGSIVDADLACPFLSTCDVSEAHLYTPSTFMEYGHTDVVAERVNSRAATPMVDASSFISLPASKRPMLPRISTLPQTPSMVDLRVTMDPRTEYSIVISMYEVYNDRIYDLLASTSRSHANKEGRRRPLLFKPTEHSPEKKVVAGLKKVVCSSLDEALMVLEMGLLERKVAGTGSNAVSSRSHGFFCIEVKKRPKNGQRPWTGTTLTIVDLAGSERARHAKTAGTTLAEAGKINESLMYLGQCMQLQSDNQDGNRNIVPYRQCKLTELLFSNSFPSSTGPTTHSANNSSYAFQTTRNPQKAIMIVTADPRGDFNATFQILRYSALAREVTVPRIPSITSTITSSGFGNPDKAGYADWSSSNAGGEDLQAAENEIARLLAELEVSQLELAEERARRRNAETSWKAAEERLLMIEQEIRDECYAEMEQRLDEERQRWKGAFREEAEKQEEHIDAKLDLLSKGILIYEDGAPSEEERIKQLEEESTLLRERLRAVERETKNQSPVKQRVLKTKKWAMEIDSP